MKIKRGGSEIGDIKEESIQDLLNAGFLLPSDMFCGIGVMVFGLGLEY